MGFDQCVFRLRIQAIALIRKQRLWQSETSQEQFICLIKQIHVISINVLSAQGLVCQSA